MEGAAQTVDLGMRRRNSRYEKLMQLERREGSASSTVSQRIDTKVQDIVEHHEGVVNSRMVDNLKLREDTEEHCTVENDAAVGTHLGERIELEAEGLGLLSDDKSLVHVADSHEEGERIECLGVLEDAFRLRPRNLLDWLVYTVLVLELFEI